MRYRFGLAGSKTPRRALIGVGLAAIVGAVVLALAPMHGNGLGGNATWPHYRGFGWYAYTPLSAHATSSELRHAGITLPHDVVNARRHQVAWIAFAGVVAVAAGAALGRIGGGAAHRRPA